jgi:hypothetical protein
MKANNVAVLLVSLGLTVLPFLPAVAQNAGAQPSQSASAPVREVAPRDLMTMRERLDMSRQMRAARTAEEKMALWTQKRAELEKRAAEKGVTLREPGSMMMHNGAQENGRMGSGERRMGGGERRMGTTGQGGGMHPRPPAGM